MAIIHPFTCYHAHPASAREVACPAYDAMTPGQRHEFALANPDNYLNVMRPADEFPAVDRPALDLNLQRNLAKLQQLLGDGTYIKNEVPGFYLYRLEVDNHVQTGLVVELPIQEFLEGHIKKHEHTRRDKEDALILYRDQVRASSTPITATYPTLEVVDAVTERIQRSEPLIDFTSPDGLKQTLWFIWDASDIQTLKTAFAGLDALYLTDGHHRSAVCQRWAKRRRDQNPDHSGGEAYNFILTALFPDRENRIFAYNRVVRGLNGLSADELIEKIRPHCDIEPLDVGATEGIKPTCRGQFSMYTNARWYLLSARPEQIVHHDPVRISGCVFFTGTLYWARSWVSMIRGGIPALAMCQVCLVWRCFNAMRIKIKG